MKTSLHWLATLLLASGLAAAPALAQQPQPAPEPAPQNQPSETDASVALKVAALLEKLKSPEFAVREKATEDIKKLGPAALPFLKSARAQTQDPDLSFRLDSLIEELAAAAPRWGAASPEGLPKQLAPQLPPQRGMSPFIFSTTFTDGKVTITKSSDANGKLRVTLKDENGKEETREFASEAEFKEKWPEVAKRFGGITLRFNLPQQPPPQRQPAPQPMPPQMDDERSRRLLELLRQLGQPGQPQQPQQLTPELMQKLMEEMMRQMLEQQGGPDQPPHMTPVPPQATAPETSNSVAGATFGDIDEAIRAQLGLGESVGLMVTAVADDSWFSTAGVKRFDIILAMNGAAISSPADVTKALDASKEGSPVQMTVIRRGQKMELSAAK